MATLPSSETIKLCAALATTSEAADDIPIEFEKVLSKNNMLPDQTGMLDALKTNAKVVQYKNQSMEDLAWAHQAIIQPSDAQLNERVALDEALEIADIRKDTPMALHFAFDEEGKFTRFYESNGQAIDIEQEANYPEVAVLDRSFHEWLTEQNMFCKGGKVYKDEDPVQLVDQKELVKLMQENNRFAHHVAQQSPKIQLSLVHEELGKAPEMQA